MKDGASTVKKRDTTPISAPMLGSSLAFCTTCAVRVVRVSVLAQRPSFWRLRRALLGRKGDSQDKRKATITSGKVKTIQTKCFTFTEEMRSGLEVQPLQVSLANQGVEYCLIAQEVESAEYRRRVSSTYTTRARTRGMVLHMLKGTKQRAPRCNDT